MPGNSDMLVLDQSFGQLIDADYYHKKMCTPKPKKEDALFNPWQNKDFKKLVNTIKQMDDPSVTDIVFFLMTIPQEIVDDIMKYINMVNSQAKKDKGKLHDFSLQITNNEQPWGGVTYMSGSSGRDVIPRLQIIATMNKYRARAGYWLALGADNSGNIQYVMFDDDPWMRSRRMDKALKFYGKKT